MLRPQVHLCLVYDTVTANITPALDPAFAPAEVIFMHGPEHKDHADALAAVLQPAGIVISYWPIADILDTEHIRDRTLELIMERETADLALNASGGTRPMSIGAYEVFLEFAKPVFYVHPENDHVTWIHDRSLASFDLADRIKLGAFFRAHGAVLESHGGRQAISAPLRQLSAELVAHAERLARPLSTLNWLAHQAQDTLVSPPLQRQQLAWPELTALIDRFAREKVLETAGRRLRFADEAARFFVNGGWLEIHTYAAVYGLRKNVSTIQDVGRSLEIVRQGSGKAVKNELDVAFIADNRLYILECKTKRYESGHYEDKARTYDTPGADTLYKLDTLKSILGGIRSRVMLVSYHPLSKWDMQRAKDLDVTVCTAGALPRLDDIIKRWLGR